MPSPQPLMPPAEPHCSPPSSLTPARTPGSPMDRLKLLEPPNMIRFLADLFSPSVPPSSSPPDMLHRPTAITCQPRRTPELLSPFPTAHPIDLGCGDGLGIPPPLDSEITPECIPENVSLESTPLPRQPRNKKQFRERGQKYLQKSRVVHQPPSVPSVDGSPLVIDLRDQPSSTLVHNLEVDSSDVVRPSATAHEKVDPVFDSLLVIDESPDTTPITRIADSDPSQRDRTLLPRRNLAEILESIDSGPDSAPRSVISQKQTPTPNGKAKQQQQPPTSTPLPLRLRSKANIRKHKRRTVRTGDGEACPMPTRNVQSVNKSSMHAPASMRCSSTAKVPHQTKDHAPATMGGIRQHPDLMPKTPGSSSHLNAHTTGRPDLSAQSPLPTRQQAPSPPHQSATQMRPRLLEGNERILLVDGSLHLLFPVPGAFSCPMTSCLDCFCSNESWTSMKRSLERHIEQKHGIRVDGSTFWCEVCGECAGTRPSSHPCLIGKRLRLATSQTFTFRCTLCKFSATSRKGLRNHLKWHTTKTRLDADTTNLPIPDTGRRHAASVRFAAREIGVVDDAPGKSPCTDLVVVNSVDDAPAPGRSNYDVAQPLSNMATDSEPTESQPPRCPVANDVAVIQSRSNQCPTATDVCVNTQPGPLDSFGGDLNNLANASPSDVSWTNFEALLVQITEKVCDFSKLPVQLTTSSSPPKVNIEDARFIQRLYRRNRRRAVRAITEGPPTFCDLDPSTVFSHFNNVWTPKSHDASYFENIIEREEMTDVPFSSSDVKKALSGCENSAPGNDRLTYKHWQAADEEAETLTAIFNICLIHHRVPECWRETKTILIPKTKSPRDMNDWRPIALSRTIYKLFAKCLTRRLSSWIAAEGVISSNQKGFMPHDGVFEHNFVLQTRMNSARTLKKTLCVAWLDCSNAFGTLPHGAVFEALKWAGVGDGFCSLIRNIYSDNYTTIMAGGGPTEVIAQRSGIKQGCPLSGLLFNLCLEPLLRRIQGDDQAKHRILAYADDVVLLADTPEELQKAVSEVERELSRLSIELNHRKSAALSLTGARPSGTREIRIEIGGKRIRHLKDGEAYAFLGRPTGFAIAPDKAQLKEFMDMGLLIVKSKLAPWQRLDALKTFFFPSLHFAMRTGQFRKGDWAYLDRVIKAEIKKTLYLPQEAVNEYLYGSTKAGSCGIPITAEDSDLCHVDGAFKLKTSSDPIIREMATADLKATVQHRIGRLAEDKDEAEFLQGLNEGEYRKHSNAINNIWTNARKASTRLNIKWDIDGLRTVVSRNDIVIRNRQRSSLMRTLRNKLRDERSDALLQLPNQGKVMECVALNPASSHFIRSGEYTRFADWRFIHRARLNLVPLNGAKPWLKGANRSCRRCNHQLETLPHVICHCMRYAAAFQRRHNAVVDRVRKAASFRYQVVSENCTIADSRLRPDLVIANNEEAIVIDVTIPFDNRREALHEARRSKITKYTVLAEQLRHTYKSVTICPLIIGALGSWDPENDSLMRKIATRAYSNKFRKLCVSDTIRWSRDIYVEHLTGSRQFDQNVPGWNSAGDDHL